ncbi:MAG: hypothetical protein ABW210_01585, partial [Achromobacter sp.]
DENDEFVGMLSRRKVVELVNPTPVDEGMTPVDDVATSDDGVVVVTLEELRHFVMAADGQSAAGRGAVGSAVDTQSVNAQSADAPRVDAQAVADAQDAGPAKVSPASPPRP